MSATGPGQDNMHYQDNSHRWLPPNGVNQRHWNALMHAHLREHRTFQLARERSCGERVSRG